MAEADNKAALLVAASKALDVVTGLPVSGAVQVLSILGGRADRQVGDAAREMYQDLVLEVQARVNALAVELEKQGRRIDEMPDIVVAAVLDRLRREALVGTSPERLDAIINAAARQFDPTFGNAAARKFWLDRLAALPDLEVFLLVNIGNPVVVMDQKTNGLYRVKREILHMVQAQPNSLADHGTLLLGGSEEVGLPCRRGLDRLKQEGLIVRENPANTVAPISLSNEGKILARLASRPGKPLAT